jgi:hypothetical protein
MDEVSDPSMAILAEGHQWYWSYQYPDFLNDDDEFIEFDSYLIFNNEVIYFLYADVDFIPKGWDILQSTGAGSSQGGGPRSFWSYPLRWDGTGHWPLLDPSLPNPPSNPNTSNGNNILKDTDRLANFFQTCINSNKSTIVETSVKFSSHPSQISGEYDRDLSRIARYIHATFRGEVFYKQGPQYTPIDNTLVQGIRSLSLNVPDRYR